MTALSRRNFLKCSAAGLAFPFIVPRSVFGRNAPSNRINTAIIGIGAQGRGHLGHMLGHSELQVLGVCDVHGGRAEHYRDDANKRYAGKTGTASYNGVRSFIDFREMFATLGSLDAVVIATPDHWHGLPAVAACEAGLDVYCEKPLGHTFHESRAMADAARRHGTIFQTGSQQRSDSTFRFGAELVRNGRIGKIKEVWVAIGGPPKLFCDLPADEKPASLNWDLWIGPAPYRPYSKVLCPDGWDFGFPNWRGYDEYGGGGQYDFGAHHFDIAQWGLGMDDSGPVDVVAPDGKDIKNLTYTYANGIKMYVGSRIKGDATTWVGENGIVSVNRGSFLYTEPASLADERFGPGDIRLYNSPNHFQNWVDGIKTRRDPICTAEIGHRTASVCHLGQIAFRLGRKLQWDPKVERFTNDTEANRLLRREMRAPWTL